MATNEGKKSVMKLNSEEDVAVALAKYTAIRSAKFIKEKGCFTVVLSGGTLIDTMRKLVEPPYINSVNWSRWFIFWVDERVVPLTDEQSNYNLAWKGFLSKVPIPTRNIFAINDNKKSPECAADDYEACIRQLVNENIITLSKASGFPKFDLMLLGMGPDGHVASLFPSRPQRYEKNRWVTFITDSPKPPPPRITFTFPVINSASEIAMVVTGSELADAVKTVLGDGSDKLVTQPFFPTFKIWAPLPASEVSAEEELIWFLDKDAAAKL